MKRYAPLIAGLALLAGCTGSPAADPRAPVTVTAAGPTVTATATATATTTASSRPRTFESPESVRNLMMLRGLVCDDWETTADINGSCQDGVILISVFPEGEQGEELYQSGLFLALSTLRNQPGNGFALIVGPNWFVRMPDDTNFEMFRSQLDGIKLR